jgi:hypothetical protein
MNTTSAHAVQNAMPAAVIAILGGGLIAGALDLLYAIVVSGIHGVTAVKVLQSVATGVLGKEAYQGGAGSAALGTLLHFFISLGAATVFYVASGRFPFLVRRPVVSGLVFGFCVFLTMRYVIVPFSAAESIRRPITWWFLGTLFTHLVLFGLPISLFTSRVRRQAISA